MSDALSPEVESASVATFFGDLPDDLRRRLFAPGMMMDFPAGTTVYRGESSNLVLVLTGVARMYREEPESGRRMAVRYVGPGDIMGLVAVVGGPVDLGVEVLEDARGWMVPGDAVRRLAQTEPQLAWCIAGECARRVYGVLDELASAAFEPVRRRIIRHLLKFGREPTGPAVVRVSQQELADSIATSREVVARSLRDLREAGLISTQPDSPGMIWLNDPDGLRDLL